jgi:Fe-S-cluster containining protein
VVAQETRVRVLALHAPYQCRSTGVCCASGWEIPVEPGVEDALRAALRDGRVQQAAGVAPDACLWPRPALPHGSRVVLATNEDGRCAFLESERGNLCAIHRQLGAPALPSACRDFPRIALLAPGGISITLSHYCPTAATMLFSPADGSARTDPLLGIVEGPPGFPPTWPYEGLDARTALPPLLRPGVLMSWAAYERWENHAVATLARENLGPHEALLRLSALAERIRLWETGDGSFDAFLERALRRDQESDEPPASAPVDVLEAWRTVAGAVPHAHLVQAPPAELAETDGRLVAPAWSSFARPVRRFLAARAFASWLALQGEGLRTTVAGLRLALGVLRAEAARGCREAGRTLDVKILTEAVRRADLLLVHLASPVALARRLSRCESQEPPATAAW